jgi:hypothetical protein
MAERQDIVHQKPDAPACATERLKLPPMADNGLGREIEAKEECIRPAAKGGSILLAIAVAMLVNDDGDNGEVGRGNFWQMPVDRPDNPLNAGASVQFRYN